MGDIGKNCNESPSRLFERAASIAAGWKWNNCDKTGVHQYNKDIQQKWQQKQSKNILE